MMFVTETKAQQQARMTRERRYWAIRTSPFAELSYTVDHETLAAYLGKLLAGGFSFEVCSFEV